MHVMCLASAHFARLVAGVGVGDHGGGDHCVMSRAWNVVAP